MCMCTGIQVALVTKRHSHRTRCQGQTAWLLKCASWSTVKWVWKPAQWTSAAKLDFHKTTRPSKSQTALSTVKLDCLSSFSSESCLSTRKLYYVQWSLGLWVLQWPSLPIDNQNLSFKCHIGQSVVRSASYQSNETVTNHTGIWTPTLNTQRWNLSIIKMNFWQSRWRSDGWRCLSTTESNVPKSM